MLKNKRSLNWPGPLGHYLLGEITKPELFSFVCDIPILKERQLCQANFTIAIKELENGDENAYYKHLRECLKDGSSAYLEDMYYMAKGELDNL